MMGFGEEGKKFPQNFFPSSPITNQPLLGTELREKSGKITIDIKFYLCASRIIKPMPPYLYLQPGDFYLIDFLRLEAE